MNFRKGLMEPHFDGAADAMAQGQAVLDTNAKMLRVSDTRSMVEHYSSYEEAMMTGFFDHLEERLAEYYEVSDSERIRVADLMALYEPGGIIFAVNKATGQVLFGGGFDLLGDDGEELFTAMTPGTITRMAAQAK
jgi:hypothetical protein